MALQGLMGMKPDFGLRVEGKISLGPTVLPDKEEIEKFGPAAATGCQSGFLRGRYISGDG